MRLLRALKPQGVPSAVLVFGAAALYLGSFYFLFEQTIRPSAYDADGYLSLGLRFENEGITSVPSDLRTFGYPWVLAQVSRLAEIFILPPIIVVLVVQLLIYAASVLVATRLAAQVSIRLASVVYLSLCLNIFVVPYFSVTLTDSIYTSIALMLFVGVGAAESRVRRDRGVTFGWVLIATLLFSVALVIRPAAIWLGPPLIAYLVSLVLRRRVQTPSAIAAVFLGSSPLMVQIFLNLKHFGVLSIFPTYDLGASQIRWGIENIKYATWLGGGECGQLLSIGNNRGEVRGGES